MRAVEAVTDSTRDGLWWGLHCCRGSLCLLLAVSEEIAKGRECCLPSRVELVAVQNDVAVEVCRDFISTQRAGRVRCRLVSTVQELERLPLVDHVAERLVLGTCP